MDPLADSQVELADGFRSDEYIVARLFEILLRYPQEAESFRCEFEHAVDFDFRAAGQTGRTLCAVGVAGFRAVLWFPAITAAMVALVARATRASLLCLAEAAFAFFAAAFAATFALLLAIIVFALCVGMVALVGSLSAVAGLWNSGRASLWLAIIFVP